MSSDAPPSYRSVVNELNRLVGRHPLPQTILGIIAEKLRQAIIKLLDSDSANTEDASTLDLANERRSRRAVKFAAEETAEECKRAQVMFYDLTSLLASMYSDSAPKEGPFAHRLDVLDRAFKTIVGYTKGTAISIASYSSRFDEVVIPICSDKKLTVDKRRSEVEEFIKDVELFSSPAEKMMAEFRTLRSKFAAFTASFSDWGLNDVDLEAVAHTRNKLSKNNNNNNFQDLLKRIDEEFQENKATRDQLNQLDANGLVEFSKNIDMLILVCKSAHNEAVRIKEWLDGGANDADLPEYMRVKHSVNIYKTMAGYLRKYAECMPGVIIPKPGFSRNLESPVHHIEQT